VISPSPSLIQISATPATQATGQADHPDFNRPLPDPDLSLFNRASGY
jgi:hypothetical protein